ncbi:MAG: protein-L-isoaspartate(D-aspartate) O-methyltransferase [Betaproteobacteria bacterium]|nr:MAG: protein-L-isoaspartate(D-aspartate) O-methyltransferase [Betaproteobacteria bacterium]TMI06084.1 MAG: protein-L-isoaspartate(D-aspartate) O-methyltransferase [Betaproteobacteria bacterium]
MTSIGEKFNGIGMTSTRTRTRMVERLREQGIKDEAVLAAMAAVPRHIFVEDALAIRAYDDSPLPIGAGQTISQPYVVARMTELLRAGTPLRRVLEIGTGCGYQTAILAQVAEEVYTVERIGSLVAKARRNLRALKANSVRIKHGDGSADLGEDLEVDGIMVTAAATQVPTSLLRYLKVGGRMVLPLARHDEELKGVQLLTVIEKAPSGIREQTYDAVRFVPLLSGLA